MNNPSACVREKDKTDLSICIGFFYIIFPTNMTNLKSTVNSNI